jgi:hypothetical protein
LYDRITPSSEYACEKFCATCCTKKVTVTTLEGLHVLNALVKTGRTEKIPGDSGALSPDRYIPETTTNRFAKSCMEDDFFPEEEEGMDHGPCVFMENDLCPVYSVRPFGCRCMVSEKKCATGGHADITPWRLTVNTFFMQYIEHLDTAGYTGNLEDVLYHLAGEQNRLAYEQNRLKTDSRQLIKNAPVPVLMIPPEDQAKIRPILDEVGKIEREVMQS